VRFLVVAATAAEAAYVPDGVPLVITGMGKTAAGVATAAALAADPDPAGLTVLNIGSAGALRDGVTGLHRPGAVLNHDLSAEAIRALGHDPEEWLTVVGGDETVLASGDVFVSDPVVRAALAERAHLVDMEGYAVAFACRRFGAAVELVKHVSDNADETALDWAAVVDRSAQELGAWLRARLAP
jgi:adenosylhomocysteine nucleosidase